MELERYSNIYSVSKLWRPKDGDVPPLQTFFPNKKYFDVFFLNVKKWKLKPVFYIAKNNGGMALIPLVEDRRKRVVSGFAPLDYFDVISTDDISFVKECLVSVFELYRGWRLSFNRINESSKLFNALSTLDGEKEICVKIDLPNQYEEYISGLSKHQRQNIRTANNHLLKDGVVSCFDSYDISHKVPSSVWRNCLEIYRNRRSTKTGSYSGFIKGVYKELCFPLFKIINKNSSLSRLYVLSFNGKPVAFAFGMLDRTANAFYTPVLSCNADIHSYSPGHILICEMVKSFINEGIETFDLARGDEPYKYAMGGENHYNYSFNSLIDDSFFEILNRVNLNND